MLGYLEWSHWDIDDRTQTLAACCLVCRDWFKVCRRELLRTISLRTCRQLKSLAATLSSTTHPIGTYIVELALSGDEHIFCEAPLFLAPKLLSLKHLSISGIRTPIETALIDHPSLTMHLNHFRTVTELNLYNMSFRSFWDFRCVIVGLLALSSLCINDVDLPDTDPFQRLDRRVPPLFSAPQNLTHLSLEHDRDWSWNPLWVWVSPLPPWRWNRITTHPFPFLTPRDVETIRKLVELESYSGLDGTFDWSYVEEFQQCKHMSSIDRRSTP